MGFSIPAGVPSGETSAPRAGILVDFIDSARSAWWLDYAKTSPAAAQEAFDIARLEMDVRKPLRAGEQVRVHLRCDRVGTSSFALNYKILREADGVVLAEAHTLQVFVDPRTQRPRPIGPETLQWLRSQA